jgi:hypothetical protein
MTIEEVAQIVLQALEEHNIPYMVVDALASNMHGIPRSTYDAVIVIEPNQSSLEEFVTFLQPDFYADKEMALDAFRRRTMFNVIHFQSSFKVDLIVRGETEFDTEEFNRRTLLLFQGFQRWIASPEDTILSKLEWSKHGESERQFNDAVNIAQVQISSLDRNYLKHWAEKLNIGQLLQKLFNEIEKS